MLVLILMLSGCTETVNNNIPQDVKDSFEEIKYTLETEYDKLKEIGIKGLSSIEDLVIDEDKLIKEIAKLEPIGDKTITSADTYHDLADDTSLLFDILNNEVGLDLEELQGTQEEYDKFSRILTEYTPLLGNYNKIVRSAKKYEDGNSLIL